LYEMVKSKLEDFVNHRPEMAHLATNFMRKLQRAHQPQPTNILPPHFAALPADVPKNDHYTLNDIGVTELAKQITLRDWKLFSVSLRLRLFV